MIRPNELTLQVNWVSEVLSDTSGIVTAQLMPGEYTLATLIDEKPFQHRFDVGKGKSQQIRIELGKSDNNSVAH